MVLVHYSLIYSCFECSLRASSHVTFRDLPYLESLLAGSRITSDQAIRLAQGQLSNISSLSGAPYKQPTHKTRPLSKPQWLLCHWLTLPACWQGSPGPLTAPKRYISENKKRMSPRNYQHHTLLIPKINQINVS